MGLEVAGWFASAFIGKLADQVRSYFGDQYEYQTNIKEKLEKLEGNVTKIQAAIHAAERGAVENSGLKTWLLDLEDACYDAEDVLDMFEYQLVKEKAKGGMGSVSAVTKKACTVVKRVFFRDDDLNELLKVLDRFDRLVDQMGSFLHLLSFVHATTKEKGESCEKANWRLTDSDFTEPQLFGRQNERTHLINLLLQNGDSESGPSRKADVLPIVGLGGMGKTTLAQSVYNDERIKQHFDLRAWVCYSDRFDLRRLITEILESAQPCIEKPSDFHYIKSLDRIRQILKKGLTGKRFLIVLDDVWVEEREKWEKLRSALESGNEGSKIIMTTRNHEIAKKMGTKEAISLEGLPCDEFWKYFVQCAFGDEKPENHPYLESIGRKIVQKLGDLPLAAKVVGALLRSELELQHWKKVLESKLWQIDEQKDGVMSVLRLSYEYLPRHLKQCFIYCSLFPKNYWFSMEKLVQLWMVQGFMHPNQVETLEMIGKSYFNGLLSRSFFQKTWYNVYVIHDLLHDLAESLSGDEIFREEDTLSVGIPKMVRHLYIRADNLPVVCNDKYAKKHLRSLVVAGGCDISLKILKELKGLRVLILDRVNQKLCSESFRQMLHLRYLEILKETGQEYELPESLCKLYHLQVLSFGDCSFGDYSFGGYSFSGMQHYDGYYQHLPKGINKLINLRHLGTYLGEVAGIGTLTCLEELCFCVKQKVRGFEIGQLGGMSQLRKLHIEGLESVEGKEQASEARLCDKRSLEELILKWDSESHVTNNNPDEEIIEGLKPHQKLELLEIRGYGGKKCPSWWNGNWVCNLNSIKLSFCSNLEILPPMGQLPFLEFLELIDMKGVKRIGPEFYGSNNTTCSRAFPSLLFLKIYGMPELTEWCSRVEGIELFPRLSKLIVNECPNLRGPLFLPSHSRQLYLEIKEGDKAIEFDGRGMLRVKCPDASRDWIPWQNLASVEEVDFRDEEMRSFPSEELEECFLHLTSLRSLDFYWCYNLQSLPSKLINSLPALQELSFYYCYRMKSLQDEGLPNSLTKLEIVYCSRELAERCEEDGADWHKISHIPTVQIMAGVWDEWDEL